MLLWAGVAIAAENDPVAGHIEGVLLRGGQPVQGVRVWWCRDAVPRLSAKNCNETGGTWTDAEGAFRLEPYTGYRPPKPGQCREPLSCYGDPGWRYWFVVETTAKPATFWRGGLGYARTFAQLACDLQGFESGRSEELECTVLREDSLKYERQPHPE
jgi:hypothetical protein